MYSNEVERLEKGTEPLESISKDRETPVHISAQESYKLLSIITFLQLLAEFLDFTGGTPVESH